MSIAFAQCDAAWENIDRERCDRLARRARESQRVRDVSRAAGARLARAITRWFSRAPVV